MIHATRAELDEVKSTLDDRLQDLASAIRGWQYHPTDPQAHRDARDAFDVARREFDTYDEVLRDWAAGPSGGDR
jgi:hypothetical protein